MLTEKGRWPTMSAQVEGLGFTSYKGANKKNEADESAAAKTTKMQEKIANENSQVFMISRLSVLFVDLHHRFLRQDQ